MKCVGAGAVPPPIMQVPSTPDLPHPDEAISVEDDVTIAERSELVIAATSLSGFPLNFTKPITSRDHLVNDVIVCRNAIRQRDDVTAWE